MIIKNHQSGFSMVELMVSMAIFGILAVVASNFLISVIRNSNQATIANEVRQNNSKIYADLEQEIRKGVCFFYSTNGVSGATFNISDVNSGLNTQCSADGNRVSYSQSALGVVTKVVTPIGGVASSPVTLNSPTTAVLDCKLAGNSCGSAAGSCKPGLMVLNQPIVGNYGPINVVIVTQQIPGTLRSDFCYVASISGTITPRNF